MTTIATRSLEDLILARLSVKTKSPLAPSDVTKSLHPFVQLQLTLPEWRVRFAQTLARMRAEALVEEAALVLTDKGMGRLQAALGITARPSAKDWRAFKARYLPRLVLAEARTDKVTDVRAALLAPELGVPVRPELEQVVRLAVAKLAGSRSARADDVVLALTSRWLQGEPPQRQEDGRAASTPAADADATSATLVEKVHAAAQSPAARRFGPNKVFIASVWEALRRDPEVSALGEGGFKRALAEAHRQGVLVLARADLVAAMDPHDVTASEVQHLNATYHFIQLEGAAR